MLDRRLNSEQKCSHHVGKYLVLVKVYIYNDNDVMSSHTVTVKRHFSSTCKLKYLQIDRNERGYEQGSKSVIYLEIKFTKQDYFMISQWPSKNKFVVPGYPEVMQSVFFFLQMILVVL